MNDWYPRFYYRLRNKTSNVWYVGQRKYNDVGSRYFGSGPLWDNHCKKYGGKTAENLELEELVFFEEQSKAQEWLDALIEKEGSYWTSNRTDCANQVPETTDNNVRPMLTEEVVRKKVLNTDYVKVTEKRMKKMDYSEVSKKAIKTRSSSDWKEKIGKPAVQKRIEAQDFEKTGKSISKTFSNEEWKQKVGMSMREKQKEARKKALQRPIVDEIRKIAAQKGIKLGRNWWASNDEKLKNIMREIK